MSRIDDIKKEWIGVEDWPGDTEALDTIEYLIARVEELEKIIEDILPSFDGEGLEENGDEIKARALKALDKSVESA